MPSERRSSLRPWLPRSVTSAARALQAFVRRTPLHGTKDGRWDRQMGTVVHQLVHGIVGPQCSELGAREIARLEALWSVFRPTSEVSRLAAQAGDQPIVVAPETVEILTHARELHALTHGALDITAGCLMRLWRTAVERGRVPTSKELAVTRALVNIADLEISAGRLVRLRRAGQQLDLGALVKGYAADRCIELYKGHGVRHAMIDLGGNVAALGSQPDGSPWRVGIQSPRGRRGEHLGYLEVRDCSVVTTGSYERVYEVAGHRYSHIVDPRTGVPVDTDIESVTVMHRSSLMADAFATAFMVLGSKRAFELASELSLDVMLLCGGRWQLTGTIHGLFHANT